MKQIKNKKKRFLQRTDQSCNNFTTTEFNIKRRQKQCYSNTQN